VDNFWTGFEKRALLGGLVRSAGGLAQRFMTGNPAVANYMRAIPCRVRALPGKISNEFQIGMKKAVPLPKAAPAGLTAVSARPRGWAARAAPKPPKPQGMSSTGKTLLTGGLLGAGAMAMSGGGQQQQQRVPY
jgi:hypothetical protein